MPLSLTRSDNALANTLPTVCDGDDDERTEHMELLSNERPESEEPALEPGLLF